MKWTTFVVAALLSPLTLAAPGAQAAGYPEKMITIVVPFPAGSTADAIPRLVAPLLTKSLGVNIIIENRGGANGSIGAARVATAPADGYTLLLATTGMMAINPWIYDKPAYNAEKDFTPITNGASTPNILVVNPSVKANSLKELIALAKAEPGKLTFASAGIGSTSHLCGETLKVLEGVDAVHIPYQGAAPALQDVIGGQVSMMCDNLSNTVQQVQSGQLRPIVVTASEASQQLPNVPTASQAGSPDLLAGNWYGFLAPAATPKDVLEKLNTSIVEALKDPTVSARMEGLGLKVIADKPAEFAATIAKDSARMEGIVKRAKAKISN
ncbi:Bug family tripartite tricarboxylate transporter substrate binding protein [Tardiphaga sp.]|jgi:tripartite-type tricarboxylate transporter receptor subunit TctC|uniref:Bug family tripartite tricarboxylate transporter substrate binding protein n=1 Tax=Tardiphaga sp. TaxID=1926292 RepID=UPI0037DA1CF6